MSVLTEERVGRVHKKKKSKQNKTKIHNCKKANNDAPNAMHRY